MNDVEELLRQVLAERAGDVVPDPALARAVRERATRERPVQVVRRGTAWAVAAAAVVAVVVMVRSLTGDPGAAGPARRPTSGPAVTTARDGRTGPTGAPTDDPKAADLRSAATTGPAGRIPLTPGTWSASPVYTGGCGTFTRGVPSTPEPPPGASSGASSGDSPGASSGASPLVSVPPGPPGLELNMTWPGVTPAVEAVHWDLDKVLDGVRFGGFENDSAGSVRVYVVRGPGAAQAAAIARSCARPDVPVHLTYVDRGYDQLRGVGASLGTTLPAAVRSLAGYDASPAHAFYDTGIDVRRNRLCLFVQSVPDVDTRRQLWVTYGDALELWVQATRTLVEPLRP